MNHKNPMDKFPCPCCGHRTLREKPGGTYNICEVCFWEDDPFQLEDPDYLSGANRVTLREGQKNYREFGACEKDMIKNVRHPNKDELRNNDWKFLE